MSRKAVGYILSGIQSNKTSHASERQQYFLEKYAESRRINLISIHFDYSKDEYGPVSSLPGLEAALDACIRFNADLVHINTGRWRKVAEMRRQIGEFKKKNRHINIEPYADELTQMYIEEATTGKCKSKFHPRGYIVGPRPIIQPIKGGPIETWAAIEHVSTQRLRTYVKLNHDMFAIIISDAKRQGMSNSDIAEAVNKMGYKTTNERLWTKDTIENALKAIETSQFKDYVSIEMVEREVAAQRGDGIDVESRGKAILIEWEEFKKIHDIPINRVVKWKR